MKINEKIELFVYDFDGVMTVNCILAFSNLNPFGTGTRIGGGARHERTAT
jgi:hypothetical protein